MGDWAEAVDDEAKAIAIAEADADQFTVGFALMGAGFIVMGIALGLWGRAVSRLETGPRATAAVVLGVAAAVGGFGPGLVRIITPLVDVEQAADESGALNVAFVLGAWALALAFVGFGILTWRGPAPRWAGILLALTGVAAAVTIPAWVHARRHRVRPGVRGPFQAQLAAKAVPMAWETQSDLRRALTRRGFVDDLRAPAPEYGVVVCAWLFRRPGRPWRA